MVACRESLNDGKQWSFYLINDSDTHIDSAVLNDIWYEWGDLANNESVSSHVTNLAAGEHALIWRDDGDGTEFRMVFSVIACIGEREVNLSFEFPKLYRQEHLKPVRGLDKPGWEEVDEG